jgi:hypothetical protein
MSIQKWWNEKELNSKNNLLQCHFASKKPETKSPRLDSSLRVDKPVSNSLTYAVVQETESLGEFCFRGCDGSLVEVCCRFEKRTASTLRMKEYIERMRSSETAVNFCDTTSCLNSQK